MSEANERQPLTGTETNQAAERRPEAIAAEPDARKQGWVPLDRYRGDPNEWIDADEFVKIGQEINPVLRANNRRLEEDLRQTRDENARLKAQQDDQGKQLKELLDVNEEAAAEARKALRTTLIADLATAHKEGDPTKIAEATAALTEHSATPPPVKPVVEEKPAPRGPTPEQVRAYTTAVSEEFPWFAQDTPVAVGMRASLGQVMRLMQSDGRITPQMTQVEATKLAAAETEGMYNVKPRQPSKVGSGRPSGNSGGTQEKSFADLPADAKTAAERSLKRMQAGGSVGKDKTFADDNAYRAHYVRQFAAAGGFDS